MKNLGVLRRCNADLHLRKNEIVPSTQSNDLILPVIEEMKTEIKSLKTTMAQNTEIMKLLSENAAILKQLAKKEVHLSHHELTRFPINNKAELENIDEDGNEQQKEQVIGILRRIIGKVGIKKNFNRIFGPEIILNFNFDGTKGKEPLRNYKNFIDMLYEAAKTEGYSKDDFRKDVRISFKLHKNRHYKNISDKKKKTTRNDF